jgi:hypothetical protein
LHGPGAERASGAAAGPWYLDIQISQHGSPGNSRD